MKAPPPSSAGHGKRVRASEAYYDSLIERLTEPGDWQIVVTVTARYKLHAIKQGLARRGCKVAERKNDLGCYDLWACIPAVVAAQPVERPRLTVVAKPNVNGVYECDCGETRATLRLLRSHQASCRYMAMGA